MPSARRKFSKSRRGNIAVMTALLLPVLVLAAGGAIDFQRIGRQKSRLQEFADMLALRGAKEFLLANTQPSQVKAVIQEIANSSLRSDMNVGDFELHVAVDDQEPSVSVTLDQAPPDGMLLSHVASLSHNVTVHSTAVARGGMNVCVIALTESGDGAIAETDNAVLDATPCSVLSNSKSPNGVSVEEDAQLKAGMICSAGGVAGPTNNFSVSPTTDCPVYDDPLAARDPPPVGFCDHNDYEVGYVVSQDGSGGGGDSGGGLSGLVGGAGGLVGNTLETVADLADLPLIEQTLQPGVYCGGIMIKDKARVTFQPGVYVVKDGPLEVGALSTLEGKNIGFYLTGDTATFKFDTDAKISMTAPKTGPMAGILFFEDRNAPLGRKFEILSEDARQLLGTLYLPRGILTVNTQHPVADSSAYTAIVAHKLDLKGAPTLVLNADYSSTDVPVPQGVGPVGGEIYLRD